MIFNNFFNFLIMSSRHFFLIPSNVKKEKIINIIFLSSIGRYPPLKIIKQACSASPDHVPKVTEHALKASGDYLICLKAVSIRAPFTPAIEFDYKDNDGSIRGRV